jgi:hypothetical protein
LRLLLPLDGLFLPGRCFLCQASPYSPFVYLF